jgi:hypothetical protein
MRELSVKRPLLLSPRIGWAPGLCQRTQLKTFTKAGSLSVIGITDLQDQHHLNLG